MKYYQVGIEYHDKKETTYTLYESDVAILEDVSFEEIVHEMRKIVLRLVDEELITSDTALEVEDDVHMFNDLMDELKYL